jgi:hypothetical protein
MQPIGNKASNQQTIAPWYWPRLTLQNLERLCTLQRDISPWFQMPFNPV